LVKMTTEEKTRPEQLVKLEITKEVEVRSVLEVLATYGCTGYCNNCIFSTCGGGPKMPDYGTGTDRCLKHAIYNHLKWKEQHERTET